VASVKLDLRQYESKTPIILKAKETMWLKMGVVRGTRIKGTIIALVFALLAYAGSAHAAPEATAGQAVVQITTSEGQLLCTREASATKCLGVPYASSPIGNLRFRPPTSEMSWTGIRNATHFASPCLQAKTEYVKAQEGSEDCLYLNIYSPPNSAQQKLPTIVWLHGGGFINGSGNAFNGTYLAETANAVVVTVNYRLGPFGWLALPSLAAESPDHATGNYGLLDSIAALKWVKGNIASFGGDPDRVTIAGQSAGGEQVLALLASPYAKGLFQRAISMSAPATLEMPTIAEAAAERVTFLHEIGCAATTDQPACLRQVPAQQMLDAANESWNLMEHSLGWTPTVDDVVLPDQWLNVFRTGHFNIVPTIIGGTRLEANLPIAILENALNRPLSQADIQGFYKRMGPIIGLVDRAYPASDFPSESERLSHISTDSAFTAGENRDRIAIAKYAPVYAYEFCDANAPESHIHARFSSIGCGHDSDLAYVFQWDDFGQHQPNFTAEQWFLAKNIGQYWGNFAATGNPNGPGLEQWPPQTSDNDTVQLLRPVSESGISTSTTREYRKDHRLNLWDALNTLSEHRIFVPIALLFCVVAALLGISIGVRTLFGRIQKRIH
jgi:para-nitrobenzyl esterase